MQDRHGTLDYMVCDEAQFYLAEQVDQLARIVDELEADVYTFGLLTSFRGLLFDGTRRLLEMADESVEVQVEARCWCGSQATHNARIVDGAQVYDGELFVVDDPETTANSSWSTTPRTIRSPTICVAAGTGCQATPGWPMLAQSCSVQWPT